jgi:hypothetical protein
LKNINREGGKTKCSVLGTKGRDLKYCRVEADHSLFIGKIWFDNISTFSNIFSLPVKTKRITGKWFSITGRAEMVGGQLFSESGSRNIKNTD